MTRYVAFLRGVNVGGVNLKMADVARALTDAGVHARGQVVHFLTASRHPPEVFVKALNATL